MGRPVENWRCSGCAGQSVYLWAKKSFDWSTFPSPLCPHSPAQSTHLSTPSKAFVGRVRLNFYFSLLLIFHPPRPSHPLKQPNIPFPPELHWTFCYSLWFTFPLVRIYLVSIICLLENSNLKKIYAHLLPGPPWYYFMEREIGLCLYGSSNRIGCLYRWPI